MTQLTYEGLIEEFWGLSTCQFKPDFEIMADDKRGGGKKELVTNLSLNSRDKVFSELRDLNFTRVSNQLKQKALYIKSMYDQRKSLSHLRDIKDFMRALPELQEEHRSLGIHTAIVQQMGKTTTKTDFRRGIEIQQNCITQDDEKGVLAYLEDAIFIYLFPFLSFSILLPPFFFPTLNAKRKKKSCWSRKRERESEEERKSLHLFAKPVIHTHFPV